MCSRNNYIQSGLFVFLSDHFYAAARNELTYCKIMSVIRPRVSQGLSPGACIESDISRSFFFFRARSFVSPRARDTRADLIFRAGCL